jgi:Mannosyl-glycoprotein endo-beta-N-acetylglucosaminidase
MQCRLGAYLIIAFASLPWQSAAAGSMPEIKISARNTVPACVTPGRLMDYLRSRNPQIDPRFDGIATEYMRAGEQLGVRWDFAFYQMIIETGALSFKRGNRSGDVKPTQNNFAGLGASGGGERGESFKDIATGIRAHLEHLLLYAGEKLENPVAERTRKVQEWGILTKWQAKFNRPLTYGDLAAQWAPGTNSYGKMLEAIADRFGEICDKPDPHPELVAQARGWPDKALATSDPKVIDAKADRQSGAELARRAIEDGKNEQNDQRSALGAQAGADVNPPVPFRVLNSAAAEPNAQPNAQPGAPPIDNAAKADTKVLASKSLSKAETRPEARLDARPDLRSDSSQASNAESKAKSAAAQGLPTKALPPVDKQPAAVRLASAAGTAKALVEATPPATGQKCRVWTASYGGQKAMIIRSVIDAMVNYTVLDVNEGSEAREAEAFIQAYAKEGSIAGEFGTQSQALDKAFELCPEG